MLSARSFLDQADRLLDRATDEADFRRAISGFYYAVFHLITTTAADRLARPGNPIMSAIVRRSFDHRTVRRVCEGLLTSARARPKVLNDLLPATVPQALTDVAAAVVELQTMRLDADYNLEWSPSSAGAWGCKAVAASAFVGWQSIEHHESTHAFLVALHVSDRAARRG